MDLHRAERELERFLQGTLDDPRDLPEFIAQTFGEIQSEFQILQDRRLARKFTREDHPHAEVGDEAGDDLALARLCRQVGISVDTKEVTERAANESSLLVECIVCTATVPISDSVLLPCMDIYCRDCIVQHFTLALRSESSFPPSCHRSEIPLTEVQHFLPAELVQKFEEKAVELRTPAKDRVYCGKPQCSAFIPPRQYEKRNDLLAQCSKCAMFTCVRCKTAKHDGNCPQDSDAQWMLELAKEKEWQRCNTCGRIVELMYGCNHITCHCGAQFCYRCGAKWHTCGCQENLGLNDPLWRLFRDGVQARNAVLPDELDRIHNEARVPDRELNETRSRIRNTQRQLHQNEARILASALPSGLASTPSWARHDEFLENRRQHPQRIQAFPSDTLYFEHDGNESIPTPPPSILPPSPPPGLGSRTERQRNNTRWDYLAQSILRMPPLPQFNESESEARKAIDQLAFSTRPSRQTAEEPSTIAKPSKQDIETKSSPISRQHEPKQDTQVKANGVAPGGFPTIYSTDSGAELASGPSEERKESEEGRSEWVSNSTQARSGVREANAQRLGLQALEPGLFPWASTLRPPSQSGFAPPPQSKFGPFKSAFRPPPQSAFTSPQSAFTSPQSGVAPPQSKLSSFQSAFRPPPQSVFGHHPWSEYGLPTPSASGLPSSASGLPSSASGLPPSKFEHPQSTKSQTLEQSGARNNTMSTQKSHMGEMSQDSAAGHSLPRLDSEMIGMTQQRNFGRQKGPGEKPEEQRGWVHGKKARSGYVQETIQNTMRQKAPAPSHDWNAWRSAGNSIWTASGRNNGRGSRTEGLSPLLIPIRENRPAPTKTRFGSHVGGYQSFGGDEGVGETNKDENAGT